jgi:pyruvate kinase
MHKNMNNSKHQIVATIGPSTKTEEMVFKMVEHNVDMIRLNLSWGTFEEHSSYIKKVRDAENKLNRKVPIMIDLPGPRIQEISGHTYDKEAVLSITDRDKEIITFGIKEDVDYFALSFVGNKNDVIYAKDLIKGGGGNQKIISKIERELALENLDEIIIETDGIMVARGDLGDEMPIEKIPFIEKDIVERCNLSKKPVIVATQMLLTMTENPFPTRAEVTDVAYAIIVGADAVMLSDETAKGKYPIEAIDVMEKIISEAFNHTNRDKKINLFEKKK